jgi:hypothetical protein
VRLLRRGWLLLRTYRAAARGYGTSLLFLLRRGLPLVRRRGFRLREVLREGLLDPALPEGVLAACIGKTALVSLQKSVNPPQRECLTEDKSLFYPYCSGLGLPVPALYAVLGRQGGYTPSGRTLAGREAWAEFLSGDVPEHLVVKPAFGYYGLGVRVLRRVGGAFLDDKGRTLAPAALYDELAAERKFRKFVFQERLFPHPELVRLSGTAALQTIRMVTYVEDGEVECNHAFLRIAVGTNLVDNYHDGKSGNLAACVGVRDGCLREGWGAPLNGVGFRRVTHHPGTGVALAGFRLPLWEEAKSLVARAATLFLPMRCIGWDVALTPSGPALIEANMWWDPSNLLGVDLSEGNGRQLASLLERLEVRARRGRVDNWG